MSESIDLAARPASKPRAEVGRFDQTSVALHWLTVVLVCAADDGNAPESRGRRDAGAPYRAPVDRDSDLDRRDRTACLAAWVCAALFHALVLRDGVLQRMLPWAAR